MCVDIGGSSHADRVYSIKCTVFIAVPSEVVLQISEPNISPDSIFIINVWPVYEN